MNFGRADLPMPLICLLNWHFLRLDDVVPQPHLSGPVPFSRRNPTVLPLVVDWGSINRLINESTSSLLGNRLVGGWGESSHPISCLLVRLARLLTLQKGENGRYQVIRQTFSTMLHRLGHGSGFGSYLGGVQSSN